jgi:hypothetical protein
MNIGSILRFEVIISLIWASSKLFLLSTRSWSQINPISPFVTRFGKNGQIDHSIAN